MKEKLSMRRKNMLTVRKSSQKNLHKRQWVNESSLFVIQYQHKKKTPSAQFRSARDKNDVRPTSGIPAGA